MIRSATPDDAAAIAEIILPTIREGATYALDRDMREADAISYWLAPDKHTFVLEEDGVTLGTYGPRAVVKREVVSANVRSHRLAFAPRGGAHEAAN